MLNDKTKIAVIGGGSWATALVKLLLNNKRELAWYIRQESTIDHIREFRRNPSYLREVEFSPERIHFFNDINLAVDFADIVVLAVPAAFLRETLQALNIDLEGKAFISAIKGMIPHKGLIIADYLNQEHQVPFSMLGVIAGPCHAEEVALERLSYLTIASENQDLAEYFASQLACRYLDASISDDLIGTEYAAVLKNIFAIAAGISHGLGYGDNYQAVLVSNAIREMARFISTVQPLGRDTNGTAYLGDLMVTAYSKFSRNRTFGNMIGKGYSVYATKLEMNMIAEGYYAVKSIYELNKNLNVFMPITDSVYFILYKNASPKEEMKKLSKLLT